tara:strand:- start:63 stop:1052 length:990 start_codon:yes stop_codon:yes gene_type:complete
MAYVDLVSSGITPVAVGAGQQTTYNWAYDTPISADGSPHITMLGIQFDMKGAGAVTLTSTLGRWIANIRIKVGSNELINFNDPFVDPDGVTPGNLSALCQKVGGTDTCVEFGTNQVLGELSLPFGLDATRSHRINITMTVNSETDWCGAALTPAASEINTIHYYGTSAEATLYGSRQDFDLTANSIRTITVYGKQGWSMLGAVAINSVADADYIDAVRVNNGAFRELSIHQWRNIDGTSWRSPLRNLNSGAGVVPSTPQWLTAREGFLFIDLMRITAGANIDLAVNCGATGGVHAFFPVWVAPVGAGTGKAPRQSAKTVQNTTQTVISE